jgi:hypothetical protein
MLNQSNFYFLRILVFLNYFLKLIIRLSLSILVSLHFLLHLLATWVFSLTLNFLLLIIYRPSPNLVRDLRRIGPFLGQTTAHSSATTLSHSKLDYCNSIFLHLPANKLHRLQLVLDSAARAGTNTSHCHHFTPVHFKSLHRLETTKRINYQIWSNYLQMPDVEKAYLIMRYSDCSKYVNYSFFCH